MTVPIDCEGHAAYLPPAQRAIHARCVHPEGAFVEFTASEAERSIVDRFEAQARRHGPRLAVASHGRRLTYAELEALINRVAHAVGERVAEPSRPVAVLLDHDAALVGAVLGILKTGGFYVVLDPASPGARLADMLRDSAAALVVTDASRRALLAEVAGEIPVMDVEPLLAGPDPGSPVRRIEPDRPAYVVYTSGSTGAPKGVVHTHRTVMHGIRDYTNIHHLTAADRLSGLLHPSGNGAVWHLLGSVLNGASLFPHNPRHGGLIDVARWLSESGVTVLSVGASLFRAFVDTLAGASRFPRLRIVRLGSEPIARRDIDGYRRHFAPGAVLSVGLSTSETGRVTQYFIDETTVVPSSTVPAGYPVTDTQLLVLDDDRQPSASAREGEIAVRSAFLSPGYWRKPDLTRAVFSCDPCGGDERIYRTGDRGTLRADGCLVLHGRQDDRIKLRGYRIEPLEVELTLGEVDGVRDAAVVARDDGGGSRLVAYVTTGAEPGPSVAALRGHLAARLPEWMVPAVIVVTDDLPRTRTGKIDRRALPPPPRERPDLDVPYVAPRTPVEVLIARLWRETLGLDRVGLRDRFVEIGGDSLSAGRLAAQVRKALGVEVSLADLLGTSTVAEMAVAVTVALAGGHAGRPESPASTGTSKQTP